MILTLVCHAAVYKPHCDQNKSEIKRIQSEENMSLPQDIDYFTLSVSLSQEVREILDRFRPTTVSLNFTAFCDIKKLILFVTCRCVCRLAGSCYPSGRHDSCGYRQSLQVRCPYKETGEHDERKASGQRRGKRRGAVQKKCINNPSIRETENVKKKYLFWEDKKKIQDFHSEGRGNM